MKARVIALYLPQFHPIPENDKWWGKGFTEWTNVGKARPLFRGHYQPRVPADLGYYDLRVPETRQAQADMARKYGVEGFCYWHYWFGNGKQLLEKPFNEVLTSGKPDFPFCLAWANETWKGFDHGVTGRNVLIEQHYPGVDDYTAHFYKVLPAFKDKRYITVDGKPFFMIYKPLADPEVLVFMQVWRRLAVENGLPGIYFVGHNNDPRCTVDQILATGVDAVNTVGLMDYVTCHRSFIKKVVGKLNKMFRGVPLTFPYKQTSRYFLNQQEDVRENVFPSIIPGWDHTPRSGKMGVVMTGSTPALFGKHVHKALELIQHKQPEHKILIIKSWNEWAEVNYMEPDRRWGLGYLEELKNQLKDEESKDC